MKKNLLTEEMRITNFSFRKIFVMMRLTLYLFFMFVIQVSATDLYGQEQRISLDLRNTTVNEALNSIEQQTQYFFLFNNKLIDINREVTAKYDNAEIKHVLQGLFEGTSVEYIIKGRQIILTDQQQEVSQVKGKITDSSGAPLPGVTVVVKGTTNGTITDFDGRYVLSNIPAGAILQFSFVGMKMQEIVVDGRSTIDLVMEEDAIGIEEVVAVGYGTMKKSDLTGSVVSANIEAFRESPNVSIMQSLQGSVPGVQIGQTNQAGEEASISIRGTSTINGNTSPLIILDGIIYRGNIARLNPNDIKSIDILKDASSKAIYGAQAANGVIIITSKGGKTNKKPSIEYSVSASTQAPTVNARLLNQQEFLQKIKDVNYQTAYLADGYTEENPNWDFTQTELLASNLNGIENGTNYDWWDALTSPGHIIDHNLSLSGGTNNTSYFISGGFTDYEGFIMNDDYQRSSVRINFETEVNSWLTVGANTFGSFTDYSGSYPNMGYIATTSPFVTPKDENGDYIINPFGDYIINPFLNAMSDDKDLRNSISGNFFGIVSIPWIKGLSYRINYSNNLSWATHSYSNVYGSNQAGSAYKAMSATHDILLDNIITYDKKIKDDHSIQLTFVYGATKTEFDRTEASGTNYSNLDLSYNSLQQATIQTIESSAWQESSVYQMGRVNYNYKNRYLLTATIRRDGFSGFSKDNKFGMFPSIGIGWILSDENFYNLPAIEYVKLRVSYGENGNLTSRYSSLAKVASDSDSQYVFGDGSSTYLGQSPTSLANNALSWETTTGFNFGVDFMALDSRIRGNVEYYMTTTTDLLWDMSLPQMTGFSSIKTNLGKIANSGVELALYTTPVKTKDFTWNLDFNISTNKNQIKELLGKDDDGDGKEDDLISSGLFIGESIGTIYNYEIDGIWQLDDEVMTGYYPGTYKIVDQDGDEDITAANDRTILGKEEPAYQFGIQNTLSYKNFSLHFFVNSIQGGKNSYLGKNSIGSITTGLAQNQNWFNFYDYWSPSNPGARYADYWLTAAINPSRYESRSFVRLQDVSLSYRLNPSLLEKFGVGSAKIYLSGKNLLTFTKWNGWDPETGQGVSKSNSYPVMRTFSLGIDLSF